MVLRPRKHRYQGFLLAVQAVLAVGSIGYVFNRRYFDKISDEKYGTEVPEYDLLMMGKDLVGQKGLVRVM